MNTFISSPNWARALLAVAMSAATISIASARNWNEGDPAPALESFALKGQLPPYAGKVTLIDFWASWCVPCKASFPEVESLYQRFGDNGFQVVAINLDADSKAMRRFLDRQNITFTVAQDAEQQTVKAAGIETFPSSFLVDKHGVIRFVHEGWHGRKSSEELATEIEQLLTEE